MNKGLHKQRPKSDPISKTFQLMERAAKMAESFDYEGLRIFGGGDHPSTGFRVVTDRSEVIIRPHRSK